MGSFIIFLAINIWCTSEKGIIYWLECKYSNKYVANLYLVWIFYFQNNCNKYVINKGLNKFICIFIKS
jgi:hypothetical protein